MVSSVAGVSVKWRGLTEISAIFVSEEDHVKCQDEGRLGIPAASVERIGGPGTDSLGESGARVACVGGVYLITMYRGG